MLFFLPKVNKEWKHSLQVSKLRKKTLMSSHITSSDVAIVQWFLQLWEPKIKEQEQNNWPSQQKSLGKGEHEIRSKQEEYVLIHQKINHYKTHNRAESFFKWNHIFLGRSDGKSSSCF